MTTKLEQAARHYMSVFGQALEAHWIPFSKDQLSAESALREALDHIADSGKLIPQFIPVGIVNDHHSIDWMEEIVEDQAPIGAILYAKEQK